MVVYSLIFEATTVIKEMFRATLLHHVNQLVVYVHSRSNVNAFFHKTTSRWIENAQDYTDVSISSALTKRVSIKLESIKVSNSKRVCK